MQVLGFEDALEPAMGRPLQAKIKQVRTKGSSSKLAEILKSMEVAEEQPKHLSSAKCIT